MYAFLNKYGQALAFGIGVLVVLIFMVNIFTTDAAVLTSLTDDSLTGDAKLARYNTSAFDFGLYASMALTGLAFIAAIIFGVGQVASNPKGSLKGIIGAVLLIVICFVCYSVANNDLTEESAAIQNSINKFNTDQGADFDGGTLKFVSGSIIAAVVLVGLSILSLIVFGIRGIFK
ncbi:hypothetical protein [Lewinella sp. 4G2]|uniref:hypothetical protein n=1 Tax=Lewinella sp. 4G2 TaxID=1803372 RepID=UPI0007B46915|nr:hypothetical protein [Lewinella sp. 4G2]OAV44130.1 hypothetical protein A3850_006290 [Lewinella sp. 4G2]